MAEAIVARSGAGAWRSTNTFSGFIRRWQLPAAAELRPVVTIYDCMDELSAFLGAPPEMMQREKELLRESGPGIHGRTQSLPVQKESASASSLLPQQRGRQALCRAPPTGC